MKSPMRVLRDRVLLSEPELVDPSSLIYVAEMYRAKSDITEVLAVGPNCKEIAVGDRVMIHKNSGLRVLHDGKTFIICREGELIGKVEE